MRKYPATCRAAVRLLHPAGSSSAANARFRSITSISADASSALLSADCGEPGLTIGPTNEQRRDALCSWRFPRPAPLAAVDLPSSTRGYPDLAPAS